MKKFVTIAAVAALATLSACQKVENVDVPADEVTATDAATDAANATDAATEAAK